MTATQQRELLSLLICDLTKNKKLAAAYFAAVKFFLLIFINNIFHSLSENIIAA